jgi:hypothetical protein
MKMGLTFNCFKTGLNGGGFLDKIITFGVPEDTKFFDRQSDYQLFKRVFIYYVVVTGEFLFETVKYFTLK